MLMIQMVRTMLRNEKGQGMVEYGLIMAAIAVVAMAAFGGIGDNLLIKLNAIKAELL